MPSDLYLSESSHRIQRSMMRIKHSLDQLSEEELWWRPFPHMNSIGHLILHLEGNLNQWIVDPLNQQSNHRERKEEFRVKNPQNLEVSKAIVSDLEVNLKKGIEAFPQSLLKQHVEIQSRKITYLSAIYSSITHLEGHVGQIIYITRLLKGDDYRLFNHYGLNEKLGDYQE